MADQARAGAATLGMDPCQLLGCRRDGRAIADAAGRGKSQIGACPESSQASVKTPIPGAST
jgi:hypothetical protein